LDGEILTGFAGATADAFTLVEKFEAKLKAFGVAAVYTPKDFQLNDIMTDIVRLVDAEAKAA
ncbi:MAG: HslU--HslV peptidase proteolytic subunit, partial [Pseudomonadota bacterium]